MTKISSTKYIEHFKKTLSPNKCHSRLTGILLKTRKDSGQAGMTKKELLNLTFDNFLKGIMTLRSVALKLFPISISAIIYFKETTI